MRTCPAGANETDDAGGSSVLSASVDAAASPSAAPAAAELSEDRLEWGPFPARRERTMKATLSAPVDVWRANTTPDGIVGLVRVQVAQDPDDSQLIVTSRSLVAAMLTLVMAFFLVRRLAARRWRTSGDQRRRWRDADDAIDYQADDSESIGRTADDAGSASRSTTPSPPDLPLSYGAAFNLIGEPTEEAAATLDPLAAQRRLPVVVELIEEALVFPCVVESTPVWWCPSPPDENNNKRRSELSESDASFASFGSSMDDSFKEAEDALSDAEDFVSAASPMLSARSQWAGSSDDDDMDDDGKARDNGRSLAAPSWELDSSPSAELRLRGRGSGVGG